MSGGTKSLVVREAPKSSAELSLNHSNRAERDVKSHIGENPSRVLCESPWLSTFGTNLAIFASGVIGSVLLARLFEPEDRGLIAALAFWPHFIIGLGALGLNEAVTIGVARDRAVSESARATVATTSLVLALAVAIVALPLLPLLLRNERSGYVLFSQFYVIAFVPLTYFAMNMVAVEQGLQNFIKFNALRLVRNAAYPMLLFVLWCADWLSVEAVVVSAAAGVACVSGILLWTERGSVFAHPRVDEAKAFVRRGARLHFANMFLFLSGQADKLMLISFAGDQLVGIFVVATAAASVVQTLVVTTFINIMLPRASSRSGTTAGRAHVRRVLLVLVALVFVLSGALIVIMPFLLPLVFGSKYESAVAVAQLLVVAYALIGVKKALLYMMRAWDKNASGAVAEGLTAATILVFAMPAIRSAQLVGISTLVVCANALGVAAMVWMFAKCQRCAAPMRQRSPRLAPESAV